MSEPGPGARARVRACVLPGDEQDEALHVRECRLFPEPPDALSRFYRGNMLSDLLLLRKAFQSGSRESEKGWNYRQESQSVP